MGQSGWENESVDSSAVVNHSWASWSFHTGSQCNRRHSMGKRVNLIRSDANLTGGHSFPTCTSMPSSSLNSRCKALVGVSPGSILPPGNSHSSALRFPAFLRATNHVFCLCKSAQTTNSEALGSFVIRLNIGQKPY